MQYSPKRTTGSFSGTAPDGTQFSVQFRNFMDNEFITVDMVEDQVTMHIGGQGTATMVLNANESAKAGVSFVQGAPENDELDVLVPNASRDWLPTGTLVLEDLNGTTILTEHQAVVQRRPKTSFGKAVGARDWMFLCPKPAYKVGGSNV